MNLTSCNGCGAVLDKDKLPWPKDIRNYDGSIITESAKWDGDNWVAFVECPVCDDPILKTGE